MSTFRITTVAKRGALPHTEVVTAASKAQAFIIASMAHREAQDLAPQVALTCVASVEVAPLGIAPALTF